MPASRVCPRPGCPNLQPCPTHKRGGTVARGYGADHQRERRMHEATMNRQGYLDCARCGEPIGKGEAWDLGHTDDRLAWTGPEHANECNRSAGGIKSTSKID